MTKPNPEKLSPVPKARPSAWDVICMNGHQLGIWPMEWQDPGAPGAIEEDYGDRCDRCVAEGDMHPIYPCVTGPVDLGARWGHEWALVVMRATDRDILSGSHHHTDGWSVGACSDPEGLW